MICYSQRENLYNSIKIIPFFLLLFSSSQFYYYCHHQIAWNTLFWSVSTFEWMVNELDRSLLTRHVFHGLKASPKRREKKKHINLSSPLPKRRKGGSTSSQNKNSSKISTPKKKQKRRTLPKGQNLESQRLADLSGSALCKYHNQQSTINNQQTRTTTNVNTVTKTKFQE